MSYPAKLGIVTCKNCGSDKGHFNKAMTTFCDKCFYCISRANNACRTLSHPLYEKYGYRIGKRSPDYLEMKAKGFVK